MTIALYYLARIPSGSCSFDGAYDPATICEASIDIPMWK
jgi:hypothetical protein